MESIILYFFTYGNSNTILNVNTLHIFAKKKHKYI